MSIETISEAHYYTELQHLLLIYERNNGSGMMYVGLLGILPLRLITSITSIIHMFITVHLITHMFKNNLDWVNTMCLGTILYNYLLGFHLFIMAAVDTYISYKCTSFILSMKNCWYFISFMIGLLFTVLCFRIEENNNTDIDMDNNLKMIIRFQFINTIVITISNLYPFCVFCITLGTLGVSRTFFPKSDEEVETMELATTAKRIIRNEVKAVLGLNMVVNGNRNNNLAECVRRDIV